MRHPVPRMVLVVSGLLVSGCPEPAPGEDPGGGGGATLHVETVVDGPVVLRDDVDVHILDDDVAAEAVVEPDALRFPAAGNESLRDLRPGAIMVSASGAGFLRKVVCVQGRGTCAASRAVAPHDDGFIHVSTEIAHLGEIFRDASWTWTITTDPMSGSLDPLVAGAPNAMLSLVARWGVVPRFVVQVQIENGQVIAAAAEGSAELSLDWRASLALEASFAWTRQASLPDLPVFPPQVVMIGQVPIVISLDLGTSASVAFDITARAKTTITGRCTKRVGGGLRYDGVTQTWAFAAVATELACPVDAPTLDDVEASAKASLSLRPDLKLMVYGWAGIVAGLDTTVDATLRACPPPSRWNVDLTTGYHVGLLAPLLGVANDFLADHTTINVAGGDVPTPEACDFYEWAQWPIPADAPDPSAYAIASETVTDTVTHLVWQRSAAASSLAWPDAKTYCHDLSLAGLTGWRLPSAIELQSILRYNSFSLYYSPAVRDSSVFAGPDAAYWSSSAFANQAGAAWSIDFSRNGNGGIVAPDEIAAAHAVRCVWSPPPGPTPASRYVVDPGGVRDVMTGLVWQSTPSSTSFSALADAQSYCAAQGMRVPTIKELRSLVKIRARDPAIATSWFPGTPSDRFWSNTSLRWRTVSGDYLYAWGADFSDGSALLGPQAGTSAIPALVRCVR